MATEKVFSIKIDGVDTAINNLTELEDTIESLKEELSGEAIGSERFQQLTNDISQAQGQLDQFEGALAGVTGPQVVEGFAKLGAGVTGAFAGFSVLAESFGASSKTVEELQAQFEKLNVVVSSAQAVAEAFSAENVRFVKQGFQLIKQLGQNIALRIKDTQAVLANAAAQKAANASTLAGAGAFKVLQAAIKAGPLLILAGIIGGVTLAFKLFGGGVDEAAERQKELNKVQEESIKQFVAEQKAVEDLFGPLKDDTASREEKAEATAKLIEQYGAYIPNLETEEGVLKDIEGAYRAVSAAILDNIIQKQKAAEAERIIQEIIKINTQLLEIERTQIDERLRQKFEDRLGEDLDKLRRNLENLDKDFERIGDNIQKSLEGVDLSALAENIQEGGKEIEKTVEKTNNKRVESNKKTNEQIEAEQKQALLAQQLALFESLDAQEVTQEQFLAKSQENLRQNATETLAIQEDLNNQLNNNAEEQAARELAIQEEKQELLGQIQEQSIELLFNIADLTDQVFQNRIDSIVGTVEQLQERITAQQELIAERERNVDALEQELADARGRRRENLIENLDQEREAQMALAAEEARLQAEKLEREAELARIEKQQANLRKSQAIANVIISTAQGVAQINANPAVNADITQTLRTILTALIVASGAAQIATISAQKFEDGGVIDGPSHAQGGVRGTGRFNNIEVEGGEFITNKRATERNRGILELINQRGAFENFRLTKFQNGGLLSAGVTESIANASTFSESNIVVAELRALRSETAELKNIKPVVSVTDINAGQNRVEVIENNRTL